MSDEWLSLIRVWLCDPMDWSYQAPLLWNSPGKHPWVGCHALLQGIFPTQGSNPGLLHCSQILYQLSYQGSPSRYLPREVKNTTCKDLYINDYNTFISGSKKMGEKSKHPTTRVKGKWSHSVMSNSLRPHGLEPTKLLCPWDFPGNSTGVDCPFLLQRIFPTQGSNPGLLHCRQMLYRLRHQHTYKQTGVSDSIFLIRRKDELLCTQNGWNLQ